MIYWNEPKFGEREKELVNEVLDSGYVSEGKVTKLVEKRLAEILKVKHIIMTTSCTTALWLAIEADKKIKGYKRGNVIIPDLTFVGTKNAVEMAELEPNIKDVGRDFLLAGNRINLETKIIIPVNLLGRATSISAPEGITIIYDNAGCLGSNVPIGDVACYSLQGNKIISCGQGGFCATNSDEYAKKIRELKDFGRKDKLDNNSKGFNLKFNDILAAVILGQLDYLEERKELLSEQHEYYAKELKKYGAFIRKSKKEIPLWVEFFCDKRDLLFVYLEEHGIKARKPWKPFKGLPFAETYYKRCIWLPNGPGISKKEQKEVVKRVKEFYAKSK